MMEKTESVILYLLLYLISGLLFALSVRANKGGSPFFVMAMMIPVIFAARRYWVGTDFEIYLNKYHHLAASSFSDFLSSEDIWGHIALYCITKISMFCGGSQVFFGIYALTAYLPVGLSLKKEYRTSSLLAVFLFLTGLFTDGLNVMRQVAAVSLCFYGLRFVYARHFGKYLGIVAAATLLHSSAFIAVVIYFLWDKDRQKTSIFPSVLAICGTVLAAYSFRDILQILVRFPIFSRFFIYVEDTTQANNYLIFVHIALYAALLLVRKHMNALDRRNNLLYLLIFMGICFEFTGFSLIFAKRIAMYFYELPSIVLLAQTPLLFRNNNRIVVYIGVLLFAISLFIVRYAVLGHGNIIPYRT